jgi:hypothetical protein
MIAALLAAMSVVFAPAADASQQNLLELTLPREPTHDEVVWLEIQAGVLAPGTVIRVSSSDGKLFGSVSPYGSARNARSVTYLVPLPKTAVVDGRIRVRLTVEQPGKLGRAPRADEVENVVPVYMPITK